MNYFILIQERCTILEKSALRWLSYFGGCVKLNTRSQVAMPKSPGFAREKLLHILRFTQGH